MGAFPRLFWANTSPISSILSEASIPVFTVTTRLIGAVAGPGANGAAMGKAMRFVSERGDGGVVLHDADKGAVPIPLLVYRVLAGNVWPDFNTVLLGIG